MRENLPLVDAARRLSLTYLSTLNLVLTKRLKGGRRGGHWYADRADVERLRRELLRKRQPAPQRTRPSGDDPEAA